VSKSERPATQSVRSRSASVTRPSCDGRSVPSPTAPDLGSYLELVVEYDDENVVARAYAIRCDREAPTRWE
jgi:hypothetical protein